MKPYDHPGNPDTVMHAYRRFLLALKSKWMGHGRGHRCLRAHLHYRAYIETYLAAKRLVNGARRNLQDGPRVTAECEPQSHAEQT
jgi:hypothetical protein